MQEGLFQIQFEPTIVGLLAPFAAAILAPFLVRRFGSIAPWLLALVPAFTFVHLASMLGEISNGERVTGGFQWIPTLGVNFSWMIDGLSLTFALLIMGIGVLILIYTGGYMKNHPHLGRFLAFLLLFMGAMQGLVLSDSLLTFFVFWELTSVASFLLIGFDHKREAARRAALQALLVTGIGGLSLMAGLIVLWNITGVREFSLLLATGETLRESSFYALAFTLILGGALTKSAQFPLHFWLPNAMEAPTPVSAYLHSATMVKAGVYLLMRLNPVMGETMLWETVLPLFGTLSLAAGSLLAVRQTDLKLMLGYSTVASLGLLVLLVGIGTEKAISAAALYLIAHSLFKGALFMVVGAIDHSVGTRDITKLSGLRKTMPLTFAAGFIAAISMAGITPLYGFIAKEQVYYAFTNLWPQFSIVLFIVILASSLMFAVAFSVGLRPFYGVAIKTPKATHDGSISLLAGPVVLAMAGLAAGVFWSSTHFYFASPVARSIDADSIAITTTIVPKLSAALVLSAVTIVFGVLAYLNLSVLRAAMARILQMINWGPDRGFDQFVSFMVASSFGITKMTQSGKFGRYMFMSFALLGCAILLPMVLAGELPAWPEVPTVAFFDWVIVLIATAGILAVVLAKSNLMALVMLGIQGFAVAMIYLLYGAPDLSFTQFMVETLTVVILALMMIKMNLKMADRRGPLATMSGVTIAAAIGAGFTLLLFKVLEGKFDPKLPDFFGEYSYTIAHGRNIVNVILVDFRGVDTLGEIGVVMIAGLAILALIGSRATRNTSTLNAKENV